MDSHGKPKHKRSPSFILALEDIPEEEGENFDGEQKAEEVFFTPANEEESKKLDALNYFFSQEKNSEYLSKKKFIMTEFFKLPFDSLKKELDSSKVKTKTAKKIHQFYAKEMETLQKIKERMQKIDKEYLKDQTKKMNCTSIEVDILSEFCLVVEETQCDMSVKEVIWARFLEKFKMKHSEIEKNPLAILWEKKVERASAGFLARLGKPKEDDTVLLAIEQIMEKPFIEEKMIEFENSTKLNKSKSFSLF